MGLEEEISDQLAKNAAASVDAADAVRRERQKLEQAVDQLAELGREARSVLQRRGVAPQPAQTLRRRFNFNASWNVLSVPPGWTVQDGNYAFESCIHLSVDGVLMGLWRRQRFMSNKQSLMLRPIEIFGIRSYEPKDWYPEFTPGADLTWTSSAYGETYQWDLRSMVKNGIVKLLGS